MLFKNRKLYVLNFALILALLGGLFEVMHAQATSPIVFDWAKRIGGTSYDVGTSLAIDGNGNVYTTGNFSGTVDFDPGADTYNLTSAGDVDIFISKLDTNGNFVWVKKMGGTLADSGGDIVLDGNGNIYSIGGFYGTVDFNPGAGINNLSSVGSSDIYISKLDANGNYMWAKSVGGVAYDYYNKLVVDGAGNVYITGNFSGTADFDPSTGFYNLTSAGSYDIFLAKFDNNGNLVWAKNLGGLLDDYGQGLAVDGSGNVYSTGGFWGTADFDPEAGVYNLSSEGYYDIYISKLDMNGEFVWAKSMGGTATDSSSNIKIDESGYVYSTGFYNNTVDFDPGAGVYNLTSNGNRDIFISKVDNNGDFVWARTVGGSSGEGSADLELDANGNVYIVGGFFDTADFDPGIGTLNLTSAGSGDIFISKLDTHGNFAWAKNMGGTGNDFGRSLAVDGMGNAYCIGEFVGIADFDPGTGVYNLTSAGLIDISIIKLITIPQIRYVKWNASGANNGTSWANAYTDLQFALSAASSGDEIWVAAGTNKPTTGTDRTVSFVLKNGVAIYGGFAGTETLLTQRNPATNVTILSGEIGAVGIADNSYHVVSGGDTNNTALLDGFIITAGNANGPSDPNRWGGGMINDNSSPTLRNLSFNTNAAYLDGGGMYNLNHSDLSLINIIFIANSAGSGAGMFNDNSDPILKNVIFTSNSSNSSGGGLANYNSSPTLTDVIFSGNSSGYHGGGMDNFGSSSSPTLTNVTFSENTAAYAGGGMSNNSSGGSPTLINVTFNVNSATWGGGIYNFFGNPTLTNVTIGGNTASYSGGGIYNESGNPTVANSIVWGNTGGEINNVNGGSTVVTYTIVQGGYSGAGNLNVNPLLGPLANNGGFTQTMALSSGSPAIDAGDDTNCPATDQRDVSRPQGDACDMGAYEYEPTVSVGVTIGGNNVGNYDVLPEQSVPDTYGINGGPVLVSSTDGTSPIFTSQRAIFGSSFNSVVGYPGDQLTTDYWFTSYDDLGMITYLVIGNPHPTLTAEVDVYIAGVKKNATPYSIAPGQRIFPRYGINAGPVHVVSTNGVDIFTSERTKFGNSFNEVMGYPGNQLTTDYWFTSYDDVGMITYLVIGNPHPSNTAEVDVYIAGVKKNATPYSIAPGQRIFPRYAINGGPVQVVSTNGVNIFTSERSKFGQSFNEVLGYPANQFTTDYWFTSYDDIGMITYLVIGNPHATLTAEVDVYIAGVKKNLTPYSIAPGQRVFPRYAINQGPVHVVSTNDVDIFTSERTKYLSSFNEILGLPDNQLTTDYWFTSYDDLGMTTYLIIAAP